MNYEHISWNSWNSWNASFPFVEFWSLVLDLADLRCNFTNEIAGETLALLPCLVRVVHRQFLVVRCTSRRHMVWFMAGKGKLSTWKLSQLGQLRPITHRSLHYHCHFLHFLEATLSIVEAHCICGCHDIAEAIFLLGIGKAVKAAVATVKPEAASELKVENLELSLSRQSELAEKQDTKKELAAELQKVLFKGKATSAWLISIGRGWKLVRHFDLLLNKQVLQDADTLQARSSCELVAIVSTTLLVHWHKDHGIIDGDFVVIMMAKAKVTWATGGDSVGDPQLMGFLFKDLHLQEAPPAAPPAAVAAPPAPPVAPAAAASAPPVTAWAKDHRNWRKLWVSRFFMQFSSPRQTFF